MLIASVVTSVLLICAAIAHFITAFYFRTKVMLQPDEVEPENDYGLASIVMAVRGCDPGLQKALIRLLDQDYSNYEIHLVVDHHKDNAWSVVHEVKEQFDDNRRLTIHEMTNPLKTCGLKCSALLQGLDNIHPNSKYLVLLDSDVTPHASWLSQLIAPLNDKKIGVVTGNQWFEPQDSNVGSLVRSLWYAGALVPTAIYANPWAGSFAMRMEDVHRAKLPKIWKKAIVDDGPIRQALQPLGLKIHFCPSLIMINRERCTLGFVCRYISRILTWSKMYEPTFLNTVIHCLATVVLLGTVLALFAISLVSGMWNVAGITASALAAASALNVLAYVVVRNTVSISSNLDQEDFEPIGVFRTLKLIVLAPVAYLIYGYSCFIAATRQKIQWRQITYELRGNSKVKMLGYRRWVSEQHNKEPSEISI